MVCYRGPARHAPTVPWLDEARLRADAVLLLQPLRVGRDRRAARRSHARPGLGRRVREGRRPLARHAGRLRLPRLLPPRLRLRLARRRARGRRRTRSRTPTARSGRCSRRPAGPTSSSSAMRCSSARITARPASTERFACRTRSTASVSSGPGNGRGAELAVTASNRAGMVYRLAGCRSSSTELAERLDGNGHVVLYRRERNGSRAPRRGRAALRSDGRRLGHERRRGRPRAARRAPARVGRSRQPERRRPGRLGRPGPRVRGPRRPPPRRAAEATARSSRATRRSR